MSPGEVGNRKESGERKDSAGNCEVSGCAEVIAEVWTLLDGECSPESTARLRHHLEQCPGCLQHYGVEEQIKTLVARKCGGDKAPDALRERLRLQITQTTISHTTIVRRQAGSP